MVTYKISPCLFASLHLSEVIIHLIMPASCRKDASYDIGMLLQGDFADEWIQKNLLMKKLEKPVNVPARPTKASLGHHLGALDTMQKTQERSQKATHLFKMPRFQKVHCKVSITR